ncbi:LysE family translocator [Desulfolithobacter sp.]
MENWPIFVATVTLLVLTPGPSVLLSLSHGIRYGSLKTLQTIVGNVSANAIQIVLASLGLGLLLKNMPLLFHAVKWMGVGYILLLAIRLWKQDAPLRLRQEDRHDTALARAVAKALERKQRLGHYAVIMRNGKPVRMAPEQLAQSREG